MAEHRHSGRVLNLLRDVRDTWVVYIPVAAAVQRKRRSLRLLLTTKTLENAIAAPAIIGLSRPAAASGRAATL